MRQRRNQRTDVRDFSFATDYQVNGYFNVLLLQNSMPIVNYPQQRFTKF